MPTTALVLQDRLLADMTPERKLLVSQGLRHAAWELKAAWIGHRHPELTSIEVQNRVRQFFLDAGA